MKIQWILKQSWMFHKHLYRYLKKSSFFYKDPKQSFLNKMNGPYHFGGARDGPKTCMYAVHVHECMYLNYFHTHNQWCYGWGDRPNLRNICTKWLLSKSFTTEISAPAPCLRSLRD